MANTKGSRHLSDEEKATILAEKNLALTTRIEIAEKHRVSKDTVMRIKEENLSEDIIVRAKQIESDIQKRIERVRDKALDALEHAIDNDELKKEALPNAFSTLYDKSRIESGQPTSHTGFSPEQIERFRAGFRNLLVNLFQHFHADQERPEPLTRKEADELVRIALGEA